MNLIEATNYFLDESSHVSPSTIDSHVKSIHFKEDDWDEGDLEERIYSYDYYEYDPAIPMNRISLEEFYVDEDYVEEVVEKIKATGTYEPIVVGERDVSTYTIVDGIHRLVALDMLGAKTFKGYVGRI